MSWATPSRPVVRDGSGTIKLAWIRDGNVPSGQPAPGRFDCICGDTISGVAYGGPDVTCAACGRTYDGHGWLVASPGK